MELKIENFLLEVTFKAPGKLAYIKAMKLQSGNTFSCYCIMH